MNGNVMTQNSNLPAEQNADPFTAYAAKVTATAGQFLSFDKGIWLFGPDKAKMQNGTRLAANVGGLTIHAGDLVHADLNGVTTIPREVAAEVATVATEFVAAEAIVLDYLKTGAATVPGFTEARRGMMDALAALSRRLRGK